jgi:myo-inositol-1(or 4)-monophosphatase
MNTESEPLPAEIVNLPLIRIAADLSLMAWEQMLAWRPLLGASLDARVVDTKTSPNDLVTKADAQIEALVRGYLSRVRPGDLMIGEEGSTAIDPVEFFPADFSARLHAFDAEAGVLAEFADDGPRLEWHVDPIDGTVNYVRNIEYHAFSVGVCEVSADELGSGTGSWRIGLVASPGLDATWLAAAGHGAYRIPGRLSDYGAGTGTADTDTADTDTADTADAELGGTADTDTAGTAGTAGADIPARRLRGTPPGLSGRLLATGFAYTGSNRGPQLAKLENLMSGYDDLRRCGSAALDLCMVAEGRVNGYAERGLGIYDYAGGAVIVEEAGLKVSRGGAGGPTAAADTRAEVDRLAAAI